MTLIWRNRIRLLLGLHFLPSNDARLRLMAFAATECFKNGEPLYSEFNKGYAVVNSKRVAKVDIHGNLQPCDKKDGSTDE